MQTTVPEPGQLVEVRNHPFVVTEIEPSTLAPDPLQPHAKPQNRVKLASVGEDTLGRELEVIWEIEPGTRVFEEMALPDPRKGMDDPDKLAAFLDAVRWGTVQSADTRSLHSPFRSGITIEDYQLDPLVRALQMPRVNLLIADDVGLGKTVEAGLVVRELILRHRVRSILVVCPASLQVKWRDEMRDKFGLDFKIVDSEAMRDLRRRRGVRVNPWTHHPRLITSIDYLKRERPLAMMRECLPPPGAPKFPRQFDLLIVDEAHNVAPSGAGNYAMPSQRTTAIRTLTPHFEHKLFVTATPHNGYQESFSALLELLDDQRFARAAEPDKAQLEAIMIRRMKTELVKADGTPRFHPRKIEAIEVDWSEKERQTHRNLLRYTELRRKSATEAGENVATEFVLKLLKKRLFSSPAAFATTLEKHEKTLRGRGEKKTTKHSVSVLRGQFDQLENEYEDDEIFETDSEELVEAASTTFSKLSDEEKKLLRDMRDTANQWQAKPDSKAKRLLEWLEATVRPKDKWNEERVIIFTEYRTTQKWLHGILANRGFASGGRLETIYGGMPEDERERIKAAFQANPKESDVRILLATDAASEGIDLQNWCHRAIHYEIPWNPNRLEQRNGRIDRHGQNKQPLVFHFVGKGWKEAKVVIEKRSNTLEDDLEFLANAARKVENIREDLGKVGPVIASQVEQAMLGKRSRLDTTSAEDEAKKARRILTFERKIGEQVAKLRERLDQSKKELGITPESVERVVRTGLELAGQHDLIEGALEGVWPDPAKKRSTSPVFFLPKMRASWARCHEGLEHPHSKKPRPITFDHDIAAERDDVVLAHLDHRLVQMCQRLLRAEIWSGHDHKLSRVSATISSDPSQKGLGVVVHGRLLVLGKTHEAVHEEIIVAGGQVKGTSFSRINVGQTDALLSSRSDKQASKAAIAEIARIWPKIESSVKSALEARMNDRSKSVEKLAREKGDAEAKAIEEILEELATTIKEELHRKPPVQTSFLEEEKRQSERDRETLKSRLKEIPAEIDRETKRLRARYESLGSRVFPVAIEFIVPKNFGA